MGALVMCVCACMRVWVLSRSLCVVCKGTHRAPRKVEQAERGGKVGHVRIVETIMFNVLGNVKRSW